MQKARRDRLGNAYGVGVKAPMQAATKTQMVKKPEFYAPTLPDLAQCATLPAQLNELAYDIVDGLQRKLRNDNPPSKNLHGDPLPKPVTAVIADGILDASQASLRLIAKLTELCIDLGFPADDEDYMDRLNSLHELNRSHRKTLYGTSTMQEAVDDDDIESDED